MPETFKGIIPYIVSPIDADGRVKRGSLITLTDHLIQKGVHGITVLGSAGEYPLLNPEQKATIVESALEGADGRVPVIAGVSGASIREACESARHYAAKGVAGIVVMLEMFFPLSDGQIADFYGAVAEAVPDTTLIIYSNPKYMHFELSLDVFERLAQYPNILYYKDASGNTGSLLGFKKRFGNRFGIFSASAHVPLFVMMLGGLGWMAGPACLFPEQSVALYDLAVRRKYEEAMRLQETLWEANRLFSKYHLAACLKCGLNHQGFDVGDPIQPLRPLSGEASAEVCQVVDSLFPAEI